MPEGTRPQNPNALLLRGHLKKLVISDDSQLKSYNATVIMHDEAGVLEDWDAKSTAAPGLVSAKRGNSGPQEARANNRSRQVVGDSHYS